MFNLDEINAKYEEKDPLEVLKWAILDEFNGEIAQSTSFGIGSAVTLHMVSQVDPATKVIFINTGCHFKDTLDYRDKLVEMLGLSNLVEYGPDENEIKQKDPDGQLFHNDPDMCCKFRKVLPMKNSLEGLKAWISGIMRSQSEARKDTKMVDFYNGGLYKVSPLVRWTKRDIFYYLKKHDLPTHPLFEKGYASVGCEPCTFLPTDEHDDRSGRWVGKEKNECGIHTFMFNI